ncbi:MAG: CAP domain-containing protein [Solirubrobacteraceae bacterium]|nr:CAP domain-containing protein [Solirubrobacteraceae bacterium]
MRPILATLVASATVATTAPAAQADGPTADGRERNVIHRINQVRADHGLRPLDLTPGLTRAADRHSRWQARSRRLSHQLPGEKSLTARLRKPAGGAKVGEVVFWSSRDARSARLVRAWMDSPGHRATLLSPSFSRAGIGIRTGRGGLYATVDVAG